MRSCAPLRSNGSVSRLGDAVKHIPLTRSGLDWFRYKDSRAVPSEADAAGNEVKAARARNGARRRQDCRRRNSTPPSTRLPRSSAPAFRPGSNRVLESLEALGRSATRSSAMRRRVSARCRPLSRKCGRRCESCSRSAALREAAAPEEPAEEAPAYEECFRRGAGRPAGGAPVRRAAPTAEPADPDDAFAARGVGGALPAHGRTSTARCPTFCCAVCAGGSCW